MQPIEQGGYTRQQIVDMLHGKTGPRVIKFRYDLLDRNDNKKETLTGVVSGEVRMNSLAKDIKRVANFTIREESSINIDWLNDRIQPFCCFKMPDGNWVEWSLGIFLLSSPTRRESYGQVYRDIEAYDGLQILLDDKFDTRYIITAGTNYIDAIKAILNSAGIYKINITSTVSTTRIDKEYEIGTSKLEVINELLKEINYTSLWVDENGYYTAKPYGLPYQQTPEYTYKDDDISIMYPEVEEELDLFNVPNKWVVVASNPNSVPLTSVYTNTNPNSITSTVNRGRTIVDFRQIDDIASQSDLDNYTQRIAYNASQVYGHITFKTAIMPFHSFSDILQIKYSPLNILDKYQETSWTIPLETGAQMEHVARRVVQI